MLEYLKKILRINKNVIKGELEEIRNLKPTEDDYAQGEVLADIAITAMASMGLSYTLLGKDIIAKVFAYGIRDAKDGIKDNSKLIIGRVIDEIHNERTSETELQKRALDRNLR